jgi:hypothetical protein
MGVSHRFPQLCLGTDHLVLLESSARIGYRAASRLAGDVRRVGSWRLAEEAKSQKPKAKRQKAKGKRQKAKRRSGDALLPLSFCLLPSSANFGR